MKFIEENFRPENEIIKEDPQDMDFFKDSDSEKGKNYLSKDSLDFEESVPKFNQVLFNYKSFQSSTKPNSKEVTAAKETKKTSWINKDDKLLSVDTIPLSLDLDSNTSFKNIKDNKNSSYLKKEESKFDLTKNSLI